MAYRAKERFGEIHFFDEMSDHTHPAAFEAPDIEEVARLFPNYSILRLIACGGMGAVYEATQTSLDRQIAVKILPREFSGDEAFRQGFEAEAKAMAKLNHPNLIGVYDFGEADGMLYIVMEYVAGNSLFASANGERIEQSVALSLIEGVCHGLANAHSHGILHRDIKPSNILLDQNARPKIGDFGLARALEREIQEGEQIFGTPGYTAPEVLKPPFTIDQRADIFSVGVMLHELLTGQLPDADPRPASKICGCSFRLDPIIQKATHKDPNQRFSSCTEMAEAIAKVLAIKASAGLVTRSSPSSSALPTPGKYVARKPAKSSSGLGFLVFLLLLAAAIAYFAVTKESHLGKGSIKTPEKATEGTSEVIAAIPVLPVPSTEAEAPPAEAPPAGETLDAEAFIDKLKRDINRDLADEKNSFLKERLKSGDEYSQNLKALANKMDSEAITEAVEALVAEIKANEGRVSNKLPSEINDVPGASELNSTYSGQQRRAYKGFTQKVREKKSFYIVELESAILIHEDSVSPEVLGALQAELERVNEEEDYFEDKVILLQNTIDR